MSVAGHDATALVRVLVADDQDIVRDGLVTILGLSPEIEVVGEATTGEDAVTRTAAVRPDVVLMDLRMPGIGGAAATARLRAESPGVGVLVLTTFDDEDALRAALAAGARGFLTKDAGRTELIDAIRSVAAGGTAFSSTITARLVDAFIDHAGSAADGGSVHLVDMSAEPLGAADLRAAFPELTPRERDVLAAIVSGDTNAEIAAGLFISISTVKTHVNALFSKLGVASRAEAVRSVRQRGLR